MAQSLKVSPFTTLGCPNTVLSDDFVHGSFETYKLKGTTTNGGKLDYKIKVNTTKKDGKFSAAVVDEGKVQFPLFDTLTLQLAQRRKGDLKILLDLGQFTFSGKQWNLFTAIKTETSLSNYQLNFGTNYFGPVCESNTRIELHPREAPILTHRNYIKRGSHYYGFATSLNLSTLALLRYDALIGYHNGDYDLSLKHESNSKNSKFDLGTLTASGWYNLDAQTKFAGEIQNKGTVVEPTVTVGVQHKLSNGVLLKSKIDNAFNLSLASKYALNKQITLTGALQLALKGDHLVDLNKFPPLPFGIQVDINV